MGKSLRLDKYLADMGAGTRSELRNLIRKGNVTVNGVPVKDPGAHVTEADEVKLGSRLVRHTEYEYYMLHKPAGVISATEDGRTKTVLDLMKELAGEEGLRKGIAPVGRLDIDTEGLLLMTNDGDLAHRLLAPGKHVPKLYYAELDRAATAEDGAAFLAGMEIPAEEDADGFCALPAHLTLPGSAEIGEEILALCPKMSEKGAHCALLELTEGKYHEVKRLFAARGKKVTYLKRIAMGPLVLDPSLPCGHYRCLSEEEKRYFI